MGLATARYLPERWMSAAEMGEASGIPEQVIVEKFGLRGKHIAAADEHVSDMAVEAAQRLLAETDFDPADDRRRPLLRLDVEGLPGLAGGAVDRAPARLRRTRTGSSTRTSRAARPSRCGSRATSSLAEPELRNVLLVAACRESYLLDYANERSRFMFNFGDGAVAGLLSATAGTSCSAAHAITDGSFSLQVKVPAGGSVEPASARDRRRRAGTSSTSPIRPR